MPTILFCFNVLLKKLKEGFIGYQLTKTG